MPRRRVKKRSLPPEPMAPGVIGEEFIASLRSLFQEGAEKGHFKTSADYNMVKAPIVSYMVESSTMTKAKARSNLTVKFADGSEPRAALPYLPSGFKISEPLRQSLMKARKWETFVEKVEEAMNPDIKKARNKQRALERLRKKEERRIAAAAAMAGVEDTQAPSHKDQDRKLELNHPGYSHPEGHGVAASQLTRTAEGDLENYGYSAAISHQQKVDVGPSFLGGSAGSSRSSHAATVRRNHSDNQLLSSRRDTYVESDSTTPYTDSEAEGETGWKGTPQDADAESLAEEDDPLLFTLECLAADIALLPADTWMRSRQRLIQLGRNNTTKDLSFETLLGRVAYVVMLPVELEALAGQQWERLEAAVRICARTAEVIAGDKESAEEWVQQKSRDFAWWKAGAKQEN